MRNYGPWGLIVWAVVATLVVAVLAVLKLVGVLP